MKKKKTTYSETEKINFINEHKNIFDFIYIIMQGCVPESLLGDMISKFDICNIQTLNGEKISLNKFIQKGKELNLFYTHRLRNGHLYCSVLELSDYTIRYINEHTICSKIDRIDVDKALIKCLYLMNLYKKNETFFSSKEYYDIQNKISYLEEFIKKSSLFSSKNSRLYNQNIFINSEREYYSGVYISFTVFKDLLFTCDDNFVEGLINQIRLSFEYALNKYKKYDKNAIHFKFEIFILGDSSPSSYNLFFDKDRNGYMGDIKHFLDNYESLISEMEIKNCQYRFIESVKVSSHVALRYIDLDYSELDNRNVKIIDSLQNDCDNRVFEKRVYYEQALKDRLSDFIGLTLEAVEEISSIKIKYQVSINSIKNTRIPNININDTYSEFDDEEYFSKNQSFTDMVRSAKTGSYFFSDSIEETESTNNVMSAINSIKSGEIDYPEDDENSPSGIEDMSEDLLDDSDDIDFV